MHVVLKRRGINLRAIWDDVAKPAVFQTSHWVRMTPTKEAVPTKATPTVPTGNMTMRTAGYNAAGGLSVGSFQGGTTSVGTNYSVSFDAIPELANLVQTTETDVTGSPWRYLSAKDDTDYSDQVSVASVAAAASLNMDQAAYLDTFSATVTPSTTLKIGDVLSVVTSSGTVKANKVDYSKLTSSQSVNVQYKLKFTADLNVITGTLDVAREPSGIAVILNAKLPSDALIETDSFDANHHLPPTSGSFLDKHVGEVGRISTDPLSRRAKPTHYLRHGYTPLQSSEILRDTPYSSS